MIRITDILDKVGKYGTQADLELIEKAYIFSATVHAGQMRLSGEPYLTHPMEVANILADMKLDAATIVTGILHDTVEDTLATLKEIEEGFGKDVAVLVDGLTKLSKITFASREERQAENFRKMILAMSADIRIILVKLADRVHNMRTLEFQSEPRRSSIALETLELYAPLANRLGINWIRMELEDLAFKYLYPEPYNDLVQRIDTPMEVLIAVNDVQSCYSALGVVNQTFKPIPRTIRDFIANPKPTGYQGLHARAIVEGRKFLFKIRTDEMARKAQRGIFRNWTSKTGKQGRFIREIQEMFDVLGSEESVSYRDVIAASGIKEIYTYTPQGDLICLPVNSTVLDFAFQVHTEIGHTCLGAMIRNKRYPADHVLKDGDMVRIVRADQPIRFEQQMLSSCKTPRARGELARSFNLRRRKVTVEVGASLLRQEMLRYGIPFDVLADRDAPLLLADYGLPSLDELYVRIGEGRLNLLSVIEDIKNILYGGISPLVTPTGAFNKVELTTLDPVSVKLSSCCKPNPTAKDNCALLTTKGLSVHHKNCERFRELNFKREDAVNIIWKTRETKVRKPQILHILRATRKAIMEVVGTAPEEMEMNSLELLSSYSFLYPAWQLSFTVANLYALQKVLRHFDKSTIPYEFSIDC
mgnify:CR=1 FL=1